MKKGLLLLTLLSLLLVMLAGCSDHNSSRASILIYNNEEFIGKELVSQDQYEHVQKFGTVSKKVTSDPFPKDDLSSNELAKGTEIYKVDESKLLAKVNDQQYKVFEIKK